MNGIKAREYYKDLSTLYDSATANAWSAPSQVQEYTATLSNKDAKILDIGIGTGQCIDSLYKTNKFKTIEGIDVSLEMLAHCQQKYPNVTLHTGDFLFFNDFLLDQYDLIICSGVIEFIDDLPTFFKKCRSLLSSEGSIVFTFEPYIEGHSVQGIKAADVKSERVSSVEGFMTYRHSFNDIESLFDQIGLKIKKHKLFVAYRKLNVEVIYYLFHVIPSLDQ